MKTKTIDGLRQYKAVVYRDGKQLSSTVFSDWFVDDAAAVAGLRQIMEEQGYAVSAVVVGEPCRVELGQLRPCAS